MWWSYLIMHGAVLLLPESRECPRILVDSDGLVVHHNTLDIRITLPHIVCCH